LTFSFLLDFFWRRAIGGTRGALDLTLGEGRSPSSRVRSDFIGEGSAAMIVDILRRRAK
jgi:hypothetical protein